MAARQTTVSDRELLEAIEEAYSPVVTAPELSEDLPLGRRHLGDRLQDLVDKGALETRKVGAGARVYWIAREGEGGRDLEADQAELDDPGYTERIDEISRVIEDLDVPGREPAPRRALLEEVVEFIRESGSASRSDLLEALVDEDRLEEIGYGTQHSAWKHLIQLSLSELAGEIDALESPGERGRSWSWND